MYPRVKGFLANFFPEDVLPQLKVVPAASVCSTFHAPRIFVSTHYSVCLIAADVEHHELILSVGVLVTVRNNGDRFGPSVFCNDCS